MRRVLVGVDTGRRQHQAAGSDAPHAQWLGQLGIRVSRAGFEHFRAFLGSLGVAPAQILIGVEATGHCQLTLVEDLVQAGDAVVLIDP